MEWWAGAAAGIKSVAWVRWSGEARLGKEFPRPFFFLQVLVGGWGEGCLFWRRLGAPEVHDLRRLRVQSLRPYWNHQAAPLHPEAMTPVSEKKRRGLGNSFPSLASPVTAMLPCFASPLAVQALKRVAS
jgi:hypothetical protein